MIKNHSDHKWINQLTTINEDQKEIMTWFILGLKSESNQTLCLMGCPMVDLALAPVWMLAIILVSSMVTLWRASYSFLSDSVWRCFTSVTKVLLFTMSFYESDIRCFDWSFLSFWIFCKRVFMAAACCFLNVSALNSTTERSSFYFFCNSNIFSCSIYALTLSAF